MNWSGVGNKGWVLIDISRRSRSQHNKAVHVVELGTADLAKAKGERRKAKGERGISRIRAPAILRGAVGSSDPARARAPMAAPCC